MREWLTTREAAKLLGVGMPRMSRLRAAGSVVGTLDTNGSMQYDRDSVERFARERAALGQDNQLSRDQLRAENDEARRRAWRERQAERNEAREREEQRTRLLERIAVAVERMSKR